MQYHTELARSYQGNTLARNTIEVHAVIAHCQLSSRSNRPRPSPLKGTKPVVFNGGILPVGDGPPKVVIPVAFPIGNGGDTGPGPDSGGIAPEALTLVADAPVGPNVTETPKATSDAL